MTLAPIGESDYPILRLAILRGSGEPGRGVTAPLETRITATELAKNLSDVLSRVRYRGERFLVERNGEPVATLGPATHQQGIPLRDLVARLGHLSMPGEGFADDLEHLRTTQPTAEDRPWPN